MTNGLLIWCIVLAFLGLNSALIAWFIVRLTAGPIWALVAFNVILGVTCFAIFQFV